MVKLKDLLYEKKDHEGSMAKSQLERSKEYAMMIYKIIQNVDKDGDGKVSREEFAVVAEKFPNILFPRMQAKKKEED